MNDRRSIWAGFAAGLFFSAAASAQPKVIYEKESPYNTVVVAEDAQGVRTLQFDRHGARQSVVKVGDPDYLQLPYVRALLVSLAIVEEPERVLVVGLGGGSFPTFVHKHYPRTMVDAVDIDPVVVEVAREFFGFKEDGTLRAHVRDGRKFIEECQQPYDLIVLDAYSSDSIPYHLATREFLQAVRRALTPRGIAVGNVWSRWSNPLYDSMVRTYQDVFDRVYILDVSGAGNKIFIALPRDEPLKRKDLEQRAQQVSRQNQFPLDLGELVRYGFRPAGADLEGGRVLTDKPPADTPEPVN
jgi:spermidine synthase